MGFHEAFEDSDISAYLGALWMSCADRIPHEKCSVIVCFPEVIAGEATNFITVIGKIEPRDGDIYFQGGAWSCGPILPQYIFWMPLPDAPEVL